MYKFIAMKRTVTLLLCLYTCVLAAQTTEAAWLAKADQYYDSKNYKVALDAYLQAYKLNPKNETTIYRILFAQNELKDHNSAAGLLDSLPLEMILNNDGLLEELSFTAKYSTSYEQNIELLKKARAQKPMHTGLISALATAYTNDRQFENAITMFALLESKTKPGQIDYEHWCFALNELKRFSDAAAAGKKAISAYPKHAPLYTEIGFAYKQLKQYQQARDHLVSSTEIDATNPTPWRYLGEVYKEIGGDNNMEEAIRCFNKVVSLDKATAGIYYHIGWCYNELEDFKLAQESLEKAVELNDKDGNAFLELGYAQYKLGNYNDAIVSFKKTMELDPKSELAHYYAGLTYHMLKDPLNLQKEYEALKAMDSKQTTKLEKCLAKE